MPLPEPKPSETLGEFIPRCMSDSKTMEEFPDNSQRFAVCVSQYNDVVAIVKNEVYSDYPEAVSNNAQDVLDWVAVNGWGTCGTPVGKKRCNDLANKKPVSVDVIQRMFSYLSRHKIDLESSKSYQDGCGKLMFDAWGGLEALEWSEKKLIELGLK